MWTYHQTDGKLEDRDGNKVCFGYSGHDSGRNNPSMESHAGVGPIPKGTYQIGAPYNTTTHGPYVLRLTPCPGTELYGRSGFLIHGDSVQSPGTASMGCVILPRAVREQIWASDDHLLGVEL